jgi:hypothetical protein
VAGLLFQASCVACLAFGSHGAASL